MCLFILGVFLVTDNTYDNSKKYELLNFICMANGKTFELIFSPVFFLFFLFFLFYFSEYVLLIWKPWNYFIALSLIFLYISQIKSRFSECIASSLFVTATSPKMVRHTLKCVLPFWDIMHSRVKIQRVKIQNLISNSTEVSGSYNVNGC